MKERHTKHAHGHKNPAPAEKTEETSAAEAPEKAAPSEADQLKERLLRLQADFDNFRKRTSRERTEFAQRATEDLVSELLPVLDHFELGLKTAREHSADASVREGFQLVYDQLMGVLGRAGLTAIDADGQEFDPHQHEAVTHLPSEDVPADIVLHQTRRGYRLGDKLLRAAQVVVSSGPSIAADSDSTDWGEAPEKMPQSPEAEV